MIAHAAHEAEAVREIFFVEVVEEQPADAARLVAVLQEKIFIAQLLEARIIIRTEGIAGGLGGAVPVDRVLLETIIRRQVETAAEPPHRFSPGFFSHEETHVAVRRDRKSKDLNSSHSQ